MTFLDAFKAKMLDTDNKIMTDEEYSSFLESCGLIPSRQYSVNDLDRLMLLKADFLDGVVSNPAKWNSYTQGKLKESVRPELIAEEARRIRKKHTVVT